MSIFLSVNVGLINVFELEFQCQRRDHERVRLALAAWLFTSTMLSAGRGIGYFPQPREGNPLSTESKLLVETPLEESQEDAQVTGGGKPDKPLNRGRGRGRGLGEAKRGRGRPLSDLFIDYRCC